MNTDNKKTVPVKSVKKALDLLSVLAFDDFYERGIGLKTLTEKMSAPANTIHNLLKTMCVCGYVEHVDGGRYRIGPECRRLRENDRFRDKDTLAEIEQILTGFSKQTEENSVFAVLSGGHRIPLIHVYDSQQIIKVKMPSFNQANIYSLPTGRVMYAYCDKSERDDIITINGSPVDKWCEVEEDVLRIRNDEGVSFMLSACSSEVISGACAVLGDNEQLLGALGCDLPHYRFTEKKRLQIIAAMRKTVKELKDLLS